MIFAPYSKSRFDVSDCPWAFANQYIGRAKRVLDKDRFKEVFGKFWYHLAKPVKQDMVNLVFGNVVHNILEEMLNHLGDRKSYTEDGVLALIDKHMKQEIIHGPSGYNYVDVQGIVFRFLEKWENFYDNDNLSGCEIELGILEDGGPCEYEDKDCFVRAKLDVLELYPKERRARITDHKTQLNIVDPESNFQMGLYALVVLKNYKMVDSITTRLHFARFGSYRSATYTRDDIPRIMASIRAKAKSVENRKDLTKAKRCSYCDLCPYKNKQCPLIKEEEAMGIETPENMEHAQKLFQKLIGLETQVSTLKRTLRSWCVSNSLTISVPHDLDAEKPENRITPAVAIGFRMKEKQAYDSERVREVFRKHNINIDPYLLTDKKKLDRIIKTGIGKKELFGCDDESAMAFVDDLSKAVNSELTTRFETYKVNLNQSEK